MNPSTNHHCNFLSGVVARRKSIAFIEGLMSDEDSVGGDIFLIPATGGKPQNLTPDRKTSASWLAWTRDGKIVAGEFAQGESSIISLDPTSAKIDSLYPAQIT